jgi:glycosyltransferase involved in cell wall biosynthesis
MISVVMSTYNRGHYLDRSLRCYADAHWTAPLELVIIDDGSTDDTDQVVARWAPELDITYIKLYKRLDLWRDCSSTINRGIRAARGELIIATHPEVMPGRESLRALWEARDERTYLACKVYYLTPQDQEQIDTVDWRGRGPIAVRDLPDFYERPSAELRGDDAYSHRATEAHRTWDSWVFGGLTRSTWRWFGGLSEFVTWGSVDVDFLARRRALGMPTKTMLDPQTFVVHQNHDVPGRPTDVPTPRDMQACMAALSPYPTPESARKDYI